jgi:hypothetical protein
MQPQYCEKRHNFTGNPTYERDCGTTITGFSIKKTYIVVVDFCAHPGCGAWRGKPTETLPC